MEEIYVFRVFNLLVGVIGLAISIGVILAPKAISNMEKKLDKDFSTEALEKMLNERRNLTESLLKHHRIFGFILLAVSFFLLLSNILIFY